jgi:hypothetical protein
MKCRPIHFVSLVLAVGLLVAGPAGAAPPAAEGVEAPEVGPSAHQILQEMSDYLATAGEMVFEADVSYDELTNGQMLQFGGVARVAVRRPDGLHVTFDGDTRNHEIVFDGRTFTVYDVARNLHATAEVPGDVDQALDAVFERFGFSVPIADLLYADPHGALVGSIDTGHVVGRRSIDGAVCHHLAFTQETIDWQIWVEDGARPVPRQIVITYKEEEGAPQYLARLSGWAFQPRLSKRLFEFDPPAGSDAIEFRPAAQQEVAP